MRNNLIKILETVENWLLGKFCNFWEAVEILTDPSFCKQYNTSEAYFLRSGCYQKKKDSPPLRSTSLQVSTGDK